MDEDELEGEIIAKLAREASLNAIEETFRQGRSIVTVAGEDIVRVYPNGKVELIQHIGNRRVKPKKTVCRL